MARKAKKSTVHVGDLDARHVDEAVAVPDDNQIACLSAAIRATEAGKDGMAQRGASWARQDVRAVMASPLEQAIDHCAMFADGDLRRNGRTQWSEALADALTAARTTLMVTPISVAAEAGGLLDQAAARGLEAVDARPPKADAGGMSDIEPRLTSLAHGGGCGCKIAPDVLQSILASTPRTAVFADLMVGTETSDDAAVWRLNDQQALVATTDFFMPM
ncbi:hypothetical protein LTR94_030298, partial [Friedmanniomyces endolithicus]